MRGPTLVAEPGELVVDLAKAEREGIAFERRDVPLDRAWLAGGLASTDAQVRRPGRVQLEVHIQTDRTVVVRGRLQFEFEVPCARCLDPARVDGSADLLLTFVPRKRLPDARLEDDVVDPGESELIPYDGTTVDLAPLLLEQVALAYPMRALCGRQEACRGLCSACGANLNEAGHAEGCSLSGEIQEGSTSTPPSGPSGVEGDGGGQEPKASRGETPWQRALRKLDPR